MASRQQSGPRLPAEGCLQSRIGAALGVAAWRGVSGRRPPAGLTLPICRQHTLSRGQSITLPHLCNMLLAFARLNFRPEQEDRFFSLVRSSRPVPCPLPSPSRRAEGPGGTGDPGALGLSRATCELLARQQAAQSGRRSGRHSRSTSEPHGLGRACRLGEGRDPRPCRGPAPHPRGGCLPVGVVRSLPGPQAHPRALGPLGTALETRRGAPGPRHWGGPWERPASCSPCPDWS